MSSPGPSPRHDASGSGASEEGLFFGSGDEEDFRVEDEVSNEESDAYVLDASDDERESDGESEGSPPLLDASLHEPNADKADLLHLVYVAASSEDMSKAGMYTWKTQYITGRNAQLPAAPLDESPAVPTDTAEAIRLNFEALAAEHVAWAAGRVESATSSAKSGVSSKVSRTTPERNVYGQSNLSPMSL